MSTDPRPPTLEELIKILRVAKNFRITSMEGTSETDTLVVRFTISKQDCEANDIHVRTFGSLFLAELIENLDRLATFEGLVDQYSSPDEKGATAADCVHFLNNELRHIPPGGLDGTLRRRFYSTIIKKLTELQEWRVFVDRERFEELRKQQAKAKAARDKAERERKRYEEEIRKKQEKAQQGKREKQQEYYGSGFGGFTEEQARRANEYFREQFRQAYESHFRDSFYGDFGNNSNRQKRRDDTFFWDAGTKKKSWHEILGVPIDSNKATIKAAWRRLAKQYHPDRNKEPGAAEKMVEINAAKDEGLSGAPA